MTMSPRDSAQIDAIVRLVRDVLGEDAIGAYLHGSTALDQLQPHSDIDVLVVSRRPTTPEERRDLIDRLLRISGRGDPWGDARPIELTIVVESEIRPWRYPPSFDFQYGDWMRSEFESGDLTPWETPNPDLAPVITMVRYGNRALFGPPPTEFFDPVPVEDLNRAIVEGVPGLLDDLDSDTTNVVLTFARIWTTLATGAIHSKDGAADWVLARLPAEHRPVLTHARAVYLGEEGDDWDDLKARVHPHVEHVLGEIEHLRGSESPAGPVGDDGYFGERVAARYDESSADMTDPEGVEPVIDFLAELAGSGRALELGIGTGRIALPLAQRGVPVHGIDMSKAMVARLRAKPGGEAVGVTIGDFATAKVDGSFSVAYLVFNTISNLTTQAGQVACFRNVAAHLEPGGCFVIEVGVPDLQRLPPGETIRPFHVSESRWGFDEYDVARQALTSHHLEIVDGKVERLSVPFRYTWPAELDLMAQLAGMTLRERWSGWKREPFSSDSRKHISVWEKLRA